LTLDRETLGASETPLYNSLEASYQVCRILLSMNTATTLQCHTSWETIRKDDERIIIPMIEEGLKSNQTRLHTHNVARCEQEDAKSLAVNRQHMQ
jgi:hypothetical protein